MLAPIGLEICDYHPTGALGPPLMESEGGTQRPTGYLCRDNWTAVLAAGYNVSIIGREGPYRRVAPGLPLI